MLVEIKCSKNYLTYLLRACLISFNINLVEAKTASTNLTWLYICMCIFQYEYFIFYSVHLSCTRWCFAIELLSNVLFQTFDYFWKHMLLSCWFHCVDIFYIKLRFCETCTVINSVTRTLLIETLPKFRTLSVCLPYTYTCTF